MVREREGQDAGVLAGLARLNAGGNELHAFLHDRLREHGRSGGGGRSGSWEKRSDSPRGEFGGDRKPREFGDRPPRSFEDRPARSFDDRPRTYNDKPRSFDDKPRNFGGDKPRGFGDRNDKPRSGAGGKSFSGSKPWGDKPAGGKFSDKPRSEARSDKPAGKSFSKPAGKTFAKPGGKTFSKTSGHTNAGGRGR